MKRLKRFNGSNITGSHQDGFTLVELMTTLFIAAIILTQAVPSFSNLIRNNRLITQTNDLVADINLARTEAIGRGVQVILCTSANPNAATPACNGAAGTWTTGWLVYSDEDGDSAFDSAVDTLIRIGHPAASTVTVMSGGAADANLIFNTDGTTNEGGNTATYAICDDRGVTNGREINVNAVGRPRLTTPPIASCTPA